MVVASLAQEHIHTDEPKCGKDPLKTILQLDVVSRGIYFIQRGNVNVYHKDN
jgi:hypothetical protein